MSKEPASDRPHVPGYGIPEATSGTLPWSHVAQRLERSRNYWVGTAGPDGRPHVVPVWGVWVDETLHFGGGPDTLWSRNLAANPHVAVHLESGDEVVVIEGHVDRIIDPSDPMLRRVDDAYEAKYDMRHGPPVWVLRPRIAFAWTSFPTDASRYRF
ncbi:MAG: pyridoxamine 5'-phosphate oxidase family protein [Actinomycetota bacterium]